MDIDPLGNIFLSALGAAIPAFYLFWALAIKRMKGHWAAINPEGLMYLAIGIGVIFLVTVMARVLGKNLVAAKAEEGKIHFH